MQRDCRHLSPTEPFTRVALPRSLFTPVETEFIRHGELIVSTFSQHNVACLRMRNSRGYIVALPYQGQQIWSANFDGRDLAMKSMFDHPKHTREYLENYGAFLIHCGVSAMGCPGPQDKHPLHGELPNAPMDEAWLELGQDTTPSCAWWVRLMGEWRHTVAFTCNYLIRLSACLTSASALIKVHVDVTNQRTNGSVPLMYLAHVNFKPINGSKLHYSAQSDAKHVRVRTEVPSHVTLSPELQAFIAKLASQPALHASVSAEHPYDPEVVLYLDYESDESGIASSLQVLPHGGSDVIRHQPAQLPKAVRWLSRTGDQDALGLCLPATAEPEGFAAEKAKGNIVTLAPGATWSAHYEVGALTTTETEQAIAHITATLQKRS